MDELISIAINTFSPSKKCPYYNIYHESINKVYDETSKCMENVENEQLMDKSLTSILVSSDILDAVKNVSQTLSPLKGKPLKNLLKNLRKLRVDLTDEEKNIVNFKSKSKVSLVKRVGLYLRIVVLEGIRQGAVVIDEFTRPMLKILASTLIAAGVGAVVGGAVGLFFGGVGSIPGAIGGALLAKVPILLMNGVPLFVKAMVKLSREVTRPDNPIKGVPLGLGIFPPLLLAVAPAIAAKLFITYMKSRLKTRVKAPRTKLGVTNELSLLISGETPTKENLNADMSIGSRIQSTQVDNVIDEKYYKSLDRAKYKVGDEHLWQISKVISSMCKLNFKSKVKVCDHIDSKSITRIYTKLSLQDYVILQRFEQSRPLYSLSKDTMCEDVLYKTQVFWKVPVDVKSILIRKDLELKFLDSDENMLMISEYTDIIDVKKMDYCFNIDNNVSFRSFRKFSQTLCFVFIALKFKFELSNPLVPYLTAFYNK